MLPAHILPMGKCPGPLGCKHQRWMCGHCLALIRLGRQCKGENCYSVQSHELPSRWTQTRSRTLSQAPDVLPPTRTNGTPLSSTWAELNSLHDILESNCPLLRHIPKGSVHAWGLAFTQVLETFLERLSWEALRDVLVFPKVTLELPQGYPPVWITAKGRGNPKQAVARFSCKQSAIRQKVHH